MLRSTPIRLWRTGDVDNSRFALSLSTTSTGARLSRRRKYVQNPDCGFYDSAPAPPTTCSVARL